MKLIIFDLDQTIVELFDFHNVATTKTFEQVFGFKAKLDEIDFAGKTLRQNLEELAKLKGISKQEIARKLPVTIKIYERNFIAILPKNIQKAVLPGVAALVKKLYKDKNNILVIVTGDSRVIANIVLEKAKLLHYFSSIITGERARSRIELAKQALQKAKKKAAKRKIDKIIVVGDSIRDIESGKAIGATTIAVLTGFHSKAQLKKAGAGYIFKNLADKKILKIINK